MSALPSVVGVYHRANVVTKPIIVNFSVFSGFSVVSAIIFQLILRILIFGIEISKGSLLHNVRIYIDDATN